MKITVNFNNLIDETNGFNSAILCLMAIKY
jgi:hypothetical protein